MSFFRKLKDRLTKSSSKLDAGVDALISDNNEAEDLSENEVVSEPVAEPEIQPDLAPEPKGEPEHPPSELSAVDIEPEPEVEPTQMPEVQAEEPKDSDKKSGSFISRMVSKVTSSGDTQNNDTQRNETRQAPAKKTPAKKRVFDDEMLEQLEELLIQADMGVETSLRVASNVAEGRFGSRVNADDIKKALAKEVSAILEPVASPLPIYEKKPQVILVVGVNGAGKTTTIGKLSSQLREAGKSVMIAAGDTFRAAAVEQLQIWGDRAGVPVLKAEEGSDPASLAYEAVERATHEGTDILLIDTAGRLQNREDLMQELAKIIRVIKKFDETAPHNTLLVLDATTGQNAISQVEIFRKLANITGLIMTKLDGTARGGILISLADKFRLPIHAIGVGESIDDLSPFDPDEFAAALTGTDAE